jgi:hypothetical protein
MSDGMAEFEDDVWVRSLLALVWLLGIDRRDIGHKNICSLDLLKYSRRYVRASGKVVASSITISVVSSSFVENSSSISARASLKPFLMA